MKEDQVMNGQRITLTHLDKVLFPKSGITKSQVIEYYLTVAPFFLKYAKNRAVTLERYPTGIHSKGFIQKHADFMPPWLKTVELPMQSESMRYVVLSKKADLAYLANLNTIVFHGGLSKTSHIHFPDTMILDLDI